MQTTLVLLEDYCSIYAVSKNSSENLLFNHHGAYKNMSTTITLLDAFPTPFQHSVAHLCRGMGKLAGWHRGFPRNRICR